MARSSAGEPKTPSGAGRPTKGPRPWARLTDDELVALAAAGDSEAQHRLFSRFSRLISLLASSVEGSAITYDEAVQVAQVGLWDAARTYQPQRDVVQPASFPTYATRCIQNSLHSALRQSIALKNQPFNLHIPEGGDDGGSSALHEVSGGVGDCGAPSEFQFPQEEADFEASLRQLARTLFDQLTPRERGVLIRFLRGDTYQHISEALGISYKAVDGAIQRIRKKAKNSHL